MDSANKENKEELKKTEINKENEENKEKKQDKENQPENHTESHIESQAEQLFEDFLEKKTIFLNKKLFQSNYTPKNIPHRNEQIKYIAQILAPALRLNKPSNLFIYGKTGTGKTLSVIHTTDKLEEMGKQKNIPIKTIYLNCKLKKIADTEYRLIAQLAREFGKELPATGLPTDEIYKAFFSILDEKEQILIIILDEIDQLVKKAGDEILYSLTRINSELKKSQVSIIGISNDLLFADSIDPRVKSSLSEEELIFPPYNALQIQDILRGRAEKAFCAGAIAPGVIEKCAARAAREHGDARRALDMLRVAGELAERNNAPLLMLEYLDKAEEKIERDRVNELVLSQPKQFQCIFYSILKLITPSLKQNSTAKKAFYTGEVYNIYKTICSSAKLRPLTQRRFSDILAELDMLGLINMKVISKGRYGRTKEISIPLQADITLKVIDIMEKEMGVTPNDSNNSQND